MQNGIATLENRWVDSCKIKQTCQRIEHVPWYVPKGSKNLCPYKKLHIDVITVLFIIAQTWKIPIYPSVGEWISKL